MAKPNVKVCFFMCECTWQGQVYSTSSTSPIADMYVTCIPPPIFSPICSYINHTHTHTRTFFCIPLPMQIMHKLKVKRCLVWDDITLKWVCGFRVRSGDITDDPNTLSNKQPLPWQQQNMQQAIQRRQRGRGELQFARAALDLLLIFNVLNPESAQLERLVLLQGCFFVYADLWPAWSGKWKNLEWTIHCPPLLVLYWTTLWLTGGLTLNSSEFDYLNQLKLSVIKSEKMKWDLIDCFFIEFVLFFKNFLLRG